MQIGDKERNFLKKHTNTKHQKQPKNSNLDQDITGNENKDMFYCDQCNFSCQSKKTLKKHTSKGHDDQNTYNKKSCEECQYDCTSEKDIKDHYNSNHMKDSENSSFEYPEVDEAELDEWIAKYEQQDQLNE